MQRIISKSPLRTQSHSDQLYYCQKCIELDKIIKTQSFQINEMNQFIQDCQKSLIHFKSQLEQQLLYKEHYDKEIIELNFIIESLKKENQHLNIQIQDLQSNSKMILDDFNKQFEGTLRARIENDIKDIHNKYLREIAIYKSKDLQNQDVIRHLQIKCEDLLQNIDAKNDYIDSILLKYGELDEQFQQLRKHH